VSGPARPGLLLVDDRPTSFSRYVIGRADLDVVLLRFEHLRHELPASYLEDTAHLRSFWVRSGVPLEAEAQRYRSWVRCPAEAAAPEFFCNPSEPRQALAHRFAGMIGLPHLEEQQVSWVRDKIAMKDRFRELGLATAEYARIHHRAEVLAFAAEHGWPVVLKPVDSFACIDTFLIRDAAELREVELPDRSWMVESYLSGVEEENCALVLGGEVLDIWPSMMPARPLDIVAGAINANISVATGEGVPAGLPELTQRIVTGMGLDHGYLHMEFFVEGEELRLGEVGLRVAGCEITANHGYAYGFDVFGATLDVHLGRRPELRYRHRRCAGDLLLPLPSSGLVRTITDVEELLAMPGVVAAVLKVGPGEFVTCRRASHNASGYVHIVGDSLAEVEQRMRGVLAGFTIEIDSPADTVALLP
jgi:hypothetical protein